MFKYRNLIKRLIKRGKLRRMPNFIDCFEEKLAEENIMPATRKAYRSAKKQFIAAAGYRKVVRVNEFNVLFIANLAERIRYRGKDKKPLSDNAAKTYLAYYRSIVNYACKKYRLKFESGFAGNRYDMATDMELSVKVIMQRLGTKGYDHRSTALDLPYPNRYYKTKNK